jgi:hypothetical protein
MYASSHKVSFKLIQNQEYFILVQLNLNSVSRQTNYHTPSYIKKFLPTMHTSSHKVSFKLVQNKAYFTLIKFKFKFKFKFKCDFPAKPFILSRSCLTKLLPSYGRIFPQIFNENDAKKACFSSIIFKFRFPAKPAVFLFQNITPQL